jgi:hypothetical protein
MDTVLVKFTDEVKALSSIVNSYEVDEQMIEMELARVLPRKSAGIPLTSDVEVVSLNEARSAAVVRLNKDLISWMDTWSQTTFWPPADESQVQGEKSSGQTARSPSDWTAIADVITSWT